MSNPVMLLVVKAKFMIERTNLHNKKKESQLGKAERERRPPKKIAERENI